MDKEAIIALIIYFLLAVLTFISLFGLSVFLDYQSCKQRAEVRKSVNYIYKFPAGCLIKYPWED